MFLSQTITKRHSIRKFRQLTMPSEAIDAFLEKLNATSLLYPEFPIDIHFLSYREFVQKFPQTSKSVFYAPYFLVFSGENSDQFLQNLGYLGEKAALWLSDANYGSCWQYLKSLPKESLKNKKNRKEDSQELLRTAFNNRAEELSKMSNPTDITDPNNVGQALRVDLDKIIFQNDGLSQESKEEEISSNIQAGDETVSLGAATPNDAINHNLEETSPFDLSGTMIQSQASALNISIDAKLPLPLVFSFGIPEEKASSKTKKRLPLKKCLLPNSTNLKENFESLLTAAVQAPSEYNTQPWKFLLMDQSVHLFYKLPFFLKSKRHQDMAQVAMGGVIANLFSQADEEKRNIYAIDESEDFEKLKGLRYIVSIYLSKD